MRIIGVTGSSGAGKTTICAILEEKYSAHIIDADKVAKRLTKKGTMYLNSIVEYFGIDILDNSGELKRKQLASIIYDDDEKRNALNNLTFTYVVKEIKENINNLKDKELIVIDAPLLYESNLDKICDIVVGVLAKEEDKINRICKRDNISEEMAKKRLAIQSNDDYIKDRADYIIINNGDLVELEEDIRKIGLK
ncbi:MAG: dephospho-CoA kinase [Clostridia bacterium]|nr:dephospho-CoA kinase [Clostridia bacterium]